MLTVEHLTLVLPSGSADRADRVAHLVADELARLHVDGASRVERLTATVTDLPGDRDLARRIAEAVHTTLGGAPC